MISYLSNRQSPKDLDLTEESLMFDPLIHNNIKSLQKMNEIKTQIFNKLSKNTTQIADFDKLISDPTILGRYMNFRGASSHIANYIKLLDKNTQKAFVQVDNKNFINSQGIRAREKIREKIKSQIKEYNDLTLLKFKENGSTMNYNLVNKKKKLTPRLKLQSLHVEPEVEQEQIEISRIHSNRKGRIVKPIQSKRQSMSFDFQDSPKSIALQPLTRQYVQEVLFPAS